jgi:hypothetical protein
MSWVKDGRSLGATSSRPVRDGDFGFKSFTRRVREGAAKTKLLLNGRNW